MTTLYQGPRAKRDCAALAIHRNAGLDNLKLRKVWHVSVSVQIQKLRLTSSWRASAIQFRLFCSGEATAKVRRTHARRNKKRRCQTRHRIQGRKNPKKQVTRASSPSVLALWWAPSCVCFRREAAKKLAQAYWKKLFLSLETRLLFLVRKTAAKSAPLLIR